jgi:pheromone shutdown protein TraB
MWNLVWLERGGRGIAGGEHQIMKAVQNESPAALRRKAPEAQDLLLAEREGVLRRHLSEAHDAGSAHPCDGRVMAVTAVGELAVWTRFGHVLDQKYKAPI